jgi:hypothetical protein
LFCKEKEGGDYNFSFHQGNQKTCNIANNFGSIAYGFSKDKGLTWEFRERPIINGGGNTGWDDHAIETAHVTRIGDKLHLFYSGTSMDMQSRYQIGKGELNLVDGSIYKTLMTDGKTFTRPAKPFLARQDKVSGFDNNVQEPSVVIKGDRIELFWIGLKWKLPGKPEGYPGQEIRGMGMFRNVYDLNFNLIEQTKNSIADNVNITEVKYIGGKYYMFFTTLDTSGPFHKDEKIGLMTSNDGLSWGERRIIAKSGPIDSYDGWGMFGPTVAEDGKNLVMFVTTLSVEDGKPNIANLQPGERVGIGLESETIYGGIGRLQAKLIE